MSELIVPAYAQLWLAQPAGIEIQHFLTMNAHLPDILKNGGVLKSKALTFQVHNSEAGASCEGVDLEHLFWKAIPDAPGQWESL